MRGIAVTVAWGWVCILGAAAEVERSVLVIVLDGLRPDYITEEHMPHLHALAAGGVMFDDHHAVYPTVTRVNATSISTGTYPGMHGLMGNSVYFPEVDPERGLSTGDAGNLDRIAEATGGNLVTAVSLGEWLAEEGMVLMAVSSGSSGSSYLLNHTAAGGGVINVSMIRPEAQRARVLEVLGPVPVEGTPNAGRNAWAVDAYLKVGLDEVTPRAALMWLSDPDKTAHAHGIGAPETVEALRLVDGEVGRIVAEHRARGLTEHVDILVTSDHGFSTHAGGARVGALLREHGHGDSVVTAGGALYVREGGEARARAIVELLQGESWAGAIFSKGLTPESTEGRFPGTFSFSLIQWDHIRAGDLLISAHWSRDANEAGYTGASSQTGVAGHGTTSPFEIRAALVAAGPSFKAGIRSDVPTGNVDIAPTVCRLLGIDPAVTMTGRVIVEALKDGPDPERVPVERRTHETSVPGYTLTLRESLVGGHRYFDWAEAAR